MPYPQEMTLSLDPAAAGETAGRLWGYLHRNRLIQQREMTPAAVEMFDRVYRRAEIGQLPSDDRELLRAAFIAGFRAGVALWGAVEVATSRPESPEKAFCAVCGHIRGHPWHFPSRQSRQGTKYWAPGSHQFMDKGPETGG